MDTLPLLIPLLSEQYALSNPAITLIRKGSDGNETYRVVAPDGTPFIARVYGAQGREHPDWVRYELELLVHLQARNVSVSTPVPTKDGSLMCHVAVEGATAPVALFTFADGGVEWPTTPERAHLLGESFAHLHRAGDDFAPTALPRAFDADRILHTPLRLIRPFLDEADPDDAATWGMLSQVVAQAEAMFADVSVSQSGGAWGAIHGDLHQGNCHFEGNQLTFFDFSNAGVGWRVYDLSGFLWPLRDETYQNDALIRAACDAFLNGYRAVRPLMPAEEQVIAASLKARDLWETGSWLEYDVNAEPATVRAGLRSLADQFRRFPLA